MPISPGELEILLRDALSHRHPTFYLALAEGAHAVSSRENGWLYVTIRLISLDSDGTVRDIKEQECPMVPPECCDDPSRVGAFVRQWARGLPTLVAAHGGEVDVLMPCDLLGVGALRDLALNTDAEFEAYFQDADRMRALIVQQAREMLADELSTWGLEHRVNEFIALRRDAIWFGDSWCVEDTDEDSANESEVRCPESTPVGITRFGGEPDLPPEIAWPECGGCPLTFTAQIDLDSLQEFPAARELPSTGLLSFFCGYDPHEPRMVSRVFHLPSREKLSRRKTPASGDKRPEFTVTPCEVFESLPSRDSPFYEALLPEEQCAVFHRSLAEAARGTGTVKDPLRGLDQYVSQSGYDPDTQSHRLLGYAQVYQNDPYMMSEVHATRGTWDGFDAGSPEDIALSRRSRRWRLLLQVWAMIDGELLLNQDCGAVYFMIPEESLATHDWSRVWCEMQCS